jgi:hypothetical protein
MTLSPFPTFLTFPTPKFGLPAPTIEPWQGLKIPPYLRPESLGPPTVGPEGDDFTAFEMTMAPRRRLPNRRSHASR